MAAVSLVVDEKSRYRRAHDCSDIDGAAFFMSSAKVSAHTPAGDVMIVTLISRNLMRRLSLYDPA